ncbi:MAG: T9SS type A sorting domain-containing protein [Saprospiraceae bacterium]|nr:T9SS type A sorting domain-containing protein [Saprospiraceae bacterium]
MIFSVTIPALTTTILNFPFSVVGNGQVTPDSQWEVLLSEQALNDNGQPCEAITPYSLTPNTLNWFPYRIIRGTKTITELTAGANPILAPLLPGASNATNILLIPESGSSDAPMLIIDDYYSFGALISSNKEFLTTSGATIKVESGETFNFINMNLYTCSNLAQGIVAEPGANLSIEASTISDCRFAVNAKTGASLSAVNTLFSDNYIGINLDMSEAPELGKRLSGLRLLNNTYTTNQAAINPPFNGMPESVEARGYCGIRLTDYRDFNVWDNNTFSRLANGLIVIKSTLNIGNMSFDDMNSVGSAVYPLEGYGIHLAGKGSRPYWGHINENWTNMTFNNCKTGIYANRYSAEVDNIVMTNVGTGIDWTQSYKAEIRIRTNQISARNFGIRSYHNEPLFERSALSDNTITITTAGGVATPVTGIDLQERGIGDGLDGGWPVLSNSVTMNAGGRGILYRNGTSGILDRNTVINLTQPNNYTGILTEGDIFANISRNTISQNGAIGLGTAQGLISSAGTANTYQCNCIDNTHIGAQFYDLADFSDAVRGNNLNTHNIGLQLGAAGVGDVFIGRQNRTGNLWDLSQIPGGGFGGVNWGDPDLSRFFVPGVMGSNPEHPPVDPPNLWFFPSGGSSFACANACIFPPGTGVPPRALETPTPTYLDQAIVTGNLSSHPDVVWKGNYRLYRKMLRQPAMEQYAPIYATFKSNHANLPSGKLAYIAEERATLFTLNSSDRASDLNYRSSIGQQTAALRAMDSLIRAGGTVDMNQYNALRQQKATNEINYAAFLQGIQTLRQQKIQTLLTLNAGVGAATPIIANHKSVNGILLNLLLNDEDAPSPADLALLVAIAGQCPIEGGDAVYEARAFVGRLTGQTFDDALLCAGGNRPSQGRESDPTLGKSDIILYPNPATGILQWSGTGVEAVRVRVFDLQGALVFDQLVNDALVNARALPNGIYVVQLSDQSGALLTAQKIVLQK